MLKALFALVAAALFAGVALSIAVAEHPVRNKLDSRSALDQWRLSSAASTPLLMGLALLSLILGSWAWWKTGDDGLLIGAVLLGVALLVTLLAMPLDRPRVAADTSSGAGDSLLPLGRWGRMNALRTVLGFAAVAAYLIAFLRP